MRKAYTIIERIERRIMLRTVVAPDASRHEVPRILKVHLQAIAVQRVISSKTIDHIEVFACMRHDVSRRVSHLILSGLLLHMLCLIG